MANSITRTYTFTDGTTAYGSQVDTEIQTIVNAINNADAGTTKWTVVSAANSSSTPLIADNLTGSNNVFEARVNGTAKVTVGSTGTITMGSGATIAMGSNKITGLANGTASTDAAAFGQIYYGFQAPVQATSTTASTTTNSAFQATNLTAAITLTNSAHRVKITVTGTLAANTATAGLVSIATINGTTNGDLSAAAGFVRCDAQSNGLATGIEPVCISYIDSPGTTSTQTYTVKIKSSSASNTAQWGTSGSTQVMILEEIV